MQTHDTTRYRLMDSPGSRERFGAPEPEHPARSHRRVLGLRRRCRPSVGHVGSLGRRLSVSACGSPRDPPSVRLRLLGERRPITGREESLSPSIADFLHAGSVVVGRRNQQFGRGHINQNGGSHTTPVGATVGGEPGQDPFELVTGGKYSAAAGESEPFAANRVYDIHFDTRVVLQVRHCAW